MLMSGSDVWYGLQCLAGLQGVDSMSQPLGALSQSASNGPRASSCAARLSGRGPYCMTNKVAGKSTSTGGGGLAYTQALFAVRSTRFLSCPAVGPCGGLQLEDWPLVSGEAFIALAGLTPGESPC
jgi:hypothetical protein